MQKQKCNNFLVCVKCVTYNHASFIENAMHGFAIQQTNFPFICVIIDDASTDGEPEIVKKYLDEYFDFEDQSISRYKETDDYNLVFARHKNNRNCYFVVYFLKYNHYSVKKSKLDYMKEWDKDAKYIAFCEGDDYWIHPGKLQIQVDFMEHNNDYSMCHGDANYYVYEKKLNKGNLGRIFAKSKSFDSKSVREMFYKILTNEYGDIVTNTVLLRKACYNERISNKKSFMMGDMPLWLDMSQMGRIKYINQVFGVYVKHLKSATRNSATRSLFTLNSYEMRIYYCQKYDYPIPKSILSLYKKAYLNVLIKGKNVKTLDIRELHNFNDFICFLETHKTCKQIVGIFLNLTKKKDILKIKLSIIYYYMINFVWNFFNNLSKRD